ncbi:hypothetical protein [Brachybacterium nesterenkovii]|uniref:hypothetical protein n=1 Tax=Brachybacterium nesterenkovii TaxID=47847 RepID=UPI00190F0352|nr:hypothetical protein [Brachybacterium nesterenkovii]
MPRLMAGQFCFCGDVGRGIDAGVCEDVGGGLLGGVGGVLFVVDGDAGEQGAVEDASFRWFALVVELVEVDQEFGELGVIGQIVCMGWACHRWDLPAQPCWRPLPSSQEKLVP